jgi:preprotein translocase subunit SecF
MEIAVKNYRFLLLIPIALILLSIGILGSRYMQTGEWFQRSFELTGGTMITVEPSSAPDTDRVESALADFKVSVRSLTGFTGYKLLIQTGSDADVDEILKALADAGVETTRFSVQTIGSSLGESFWYQTQIAMVVAFILMGIVVFALFRDPLPSSYVILCAFSDIVVTLAFMQVFGIELSLAGLGAILMLLGYSVDTDILLTTRFLKGTEPFGERLRSAIKTGLTMTGTTMGALIALYITAVSPVLSQIAAVLLIGLCADVILTWFQNSVLLRMYMERKGMI